MLTMPSFRPTTSAIVSQTPLSPSISSVLHHVRTSLSLRQDNPHFRSILHTSWYIIPNSPHISAIRHHRQDIPIDSSKDSDIAHNLVPLSSLVSSAHIWLLLISFRLNLQWMLAVVHQMPCPIYPNMLKETHIYKMRRRKGWAGLATQISCSKPTTSTKLTPT